MTALALHLVRTLLLFPYLSPGHNRHGLWGRGCVGKEWAECTSPVGISLELGGRAGWAMGTPSSQASIEAHSSENTCNLTSWQISSIHCSIVNCSHFAMH